MKNARNLKVGISGVRGVVGETMTPSLAASFAAAFGEYVNGGRVVVGRDTRPSGEMLERAVVAGLLSVGCQPLLAGICPTPTLQIAVAELGVRGGVVISASHNPPEWNALKFIGGSGFLLNENEAAELLDVYNQPDRGFLPEQDLREARPAGCLFDLHKKRIFSKIDADLVRRARLKVAVDCCNGVGAWFSREFLEELGCEVVTVFGERDGVFRRGPEPVRENLAGLSRAVVENKCAAGFAQDPDGDRFALVGSDGSILGEQNGLALIVEHVLSKTPGRVAVNVHTTRLVEDVARARGCEVVHSMVGEINVIEKMMSIGAVIGGEGGSGGVIWPASYPCRDSFAAMALTLEMIATRGEAPEKIMARLPLYHMGNYKHPCPVGRARAVLKRLAEAHADKKILALDGLRIDFGDSWALVRPSNTEPVMRLNIESSSEARKEELAALLSAQIKDFLGA